MNLRVDLILETEQRSASVFSPKVLGRLAALVLPILLAGFVIMRTITVMKLRTQLRLFDDEWSLLSPKSERADELIKDFQRNEKLLLEMRGWENSRLAWHGQIDALIRAVPTQIQLQSLRVSQTLLLEDKVPERQFTMAIRGRAVGVTAEQNVKRLERSLSSVETFAPVMREVDVPQYGADTSEDASKEDRVFLIQCDYKERPFE